MHLYRIEKNVAEVSLLYACRKKGTKKRGRGREEGEGRKVREEERQRGLDVCIFLLSMADLYIHTYLQDR